MPVVGAALRNHVDYAAARAADLCRIAVHGYLELLDGVLAEAVGAAARSGATGGLSEKHVVGIRPIYRQAVGGASLTSEAQVASTGRIAHDAGRQHREVEKIAAVDGQLRDRLLIDDGRGLGTRRLDHR